MPDSHSPLTPAETQRLFRTALTSGAAVGWSPPEPSELAPYFPGYEIEALIARGGMGAVYRARQLSLNRPVAIKLLPFDLGMREDFAERFRREAEALARLQHPHIVAVHDFGQADDGHYFMVMELVGGTDLATRLRNEGALPLDEALRIVRQVCEALQFAHQRGVVHRDIKPGNVLLDAAGQVKVADFGIAQFAQDEAAGDLTMTGALLGTPDYTAPEQLIVSGTVDHRADIFSLGVMLYQLLTGQLPRGVYRPVSEIVPSMRGLDVVLARAMQSDPARRYGQVFELSAGLTAAPSRRWRTVMWSTGALLGVIAAIVWMQQPKPASFTNSLGLSFVPAGTPGVLFCTTETRVRDFAASEVARRAPRADPRARLCELRRPARGMDAKGRHMEAATHPADA
jgi:serine/threonine protein kinase